MAEDLDIGLLFDKINQIEVIKKAIFNSKQLRVIELVKKKKLSEEEFHEIIPES